MRVVGVDGCKRGWVAVALEQGSFSEADVCRTFAAVLEAFPDASQFVVDIPIGCPTGAKPRAADVAAKEFVGPRWQSVFMTAPRDVLAADSHAVATARCKELTGSGISQQAFALREKILEVEALLPELGERVAEGHPEVSFRELAGEPLTASKRSWNGVTCRIRLLAGAGIELPLDLGAAGLVQADDVIDASAMAWTATRLARGDAKPLPKNAPGDDDRAVIWR